MAWLVMLFQRVFVVSTSAPDFGSDPLPPGPPR